MRKAMRTEVRPPTVGEGPKQGGDIRARWAWVEPAVWTDRMLEALEKGVKGGKWFSLMDKVYAPKNLRAAWEKVKKNRGAAGVDGESVARFEQQAEAILTKLHEELQAGRYEPQAVRRKMIPKPGSQKMRPLGIPTIRDRIVQGAMRQVLEPIWEKRFEEHSYGFRPGRSCKDALRRVAELLKNGYTWVVDADIQSYFDSIDHEVLMQEVEREVADNGVLTLLRRYLGQAVMDGNDSIEPEEGTPQGAVISPLLANIYLHPVDQTLIKAGFEAVRYADDLVVLCRSEDEARRALELLEKEMEERKLKLSPEKTRLVDATQPGGFDFLGYHFERGYRWPRKKSMKKLKDRVRELSKRTNGNAMKDIILKLNPVLRGWFNYFMHSNKTTFRRLDPWIRMRLRSINRKRQKRTGRGRGNDHQRWPNAYFAELGLFSLVAAHQSAIQSR